VKSPYVEVMAITALKYTVQEKALILGIESSCDETAASVLRRENDGSVEILSSIIASQDKEHAPFGGVVPEIAARAHMQKLDHIIDRAVTEANIDYTDLSAIAATSGPGLIGGVIAGLMGAKGLAMSLDIPLIAVNHLEGHALSPRLAGECAFPYLLLLISGGHTQLLSVKGLGDYQRIGSTVDLQGLKPPSPAPMRPVINQLRPRPIFAPVSKTLFVMCSKTVPNAPWPSSAKTPEMDHNALLLQAESRPIKRYAAP